ncbi:hypothetical protein CWS19_12480 [Escherichia coli]|uniref:Uncharacterized protein n=2 Tax=Pseudomonas aeruginosa TaxID=287 RepID=A0A2L1KIB5_PSEAI|nr:Hypothetical protein [Pseudomonas aeruginosa]EBL8749527.1 hypothetical protein [Salmonella enterica]EGR0724575.1 hypothetical protein [Vibrio cholerae]PKD53589.1 hypothetical protein CWS19_12480 [Escherichia coli]EBL8751434.1 hypothetical protein [Salmonella enterica]
MLWLQKTFDLKTIIYLKVLNKNKTNKNRNLKHPVLAKIRHQNGILKVANSKRPMRPARRKFQ